MSNEESQKKEKAKTPKGRVHIIPERCKECDLCIEFCPLNVLEKSKKTNVKGYHYPKLKEGDVKGCTNCGFCLLVCPEFAIYSSETKAEVGASK